jgi:hypothetical protein
MNFLREMSFEEVEEDGEVESLELRVESYFAHYAKDS